MKTDVILWARQCTATGKGMNEGYCFFDGEAYFISEEDATKYAIEECGYASLTEAYEDEAYYYTAWEDESDLEYKELPDGTIVEIN